MVTAGKAENHRLVHTQDWKRKKKAVNFEIG